MTSSPSTQHDVAQAAAIPYRRRNGALQFCLVNSSGGRWLFPKGTIGNEQTHLEVAELEALEEAGLHGKLDSDAVGTFLHRKQDRKFVVIAFLMEVTQEDEHWKEDDWRVRRWVPADSAPDYLADEQAEIAALASDRLSQAS